LGAVALATAPSSPVVGIMSRVKHGNHDLAPGSGEIEFWVGERHRRPDFWECFFVDEEDDTNASCANLPPDMVFICIVRDTVDGHHVCKISWNISKPRKIFWHIVHYD
jgi:leucyl aminopeptidase (aminopeptidase T)